MRLRSPSPWPVLLLVAVGVMAACSEDDRFRLPTEPGDFLQLTTTTGETTLPADGASTLGLVARISPQSTERTISFTTNAGALIGSDGTAGPTQEVEIDGSGAARLDLRSSTEPGTARVTARVKNAGEISDTLEIELEPVEDVIRFVDPPASAPADGATRTAFTVEVPTDFPTASTVTFSTTAGTLVPASGVVPVEVDHRATVDLRSPAEISTARITATSGDFSISTSIDFRRALADFVTVEASDLEVTRGSEVTITATLLRDLGDVTPGTVVTFRAVHETEGELDGFRNVERSQANGTASATLVTGEDTPVGRVTISVGTDPASAEGSVEIEIVPPP